ncbi:hypothetical protein BZM27_53615, partial [Paraburkholderia steynii]
MHRLHATVYACSIGPATAMGANPAEALIATNDVYDRLFGGNRVIMPDRGWNLIRSMAARRSPHHRAVPHVQHALDVVSTTTRRSKCTVASRVRHATSNSVQKNVRRGGQTVTPDTKSLLQELPAGL